MTTWLQRHKWAFIVAVFVGMCAAMPMIVAPLYLGKTYHGIQYAPLDDEEIYRARIQDVLDGHWSVAQAHLYEYKDTASSVPPINEWLYALPALIFGLSWVIVASKFLLPAALFFFAYLLIRRLTEHELTALAGGLLTFFSVEFADYGYILSLLHGAWPRPLLWTRLVNPIVGVVELFVFLNLLFSIIKREWKYAQWGAGASLALMVGYYFSFGIALALLGVLFLIYLARKEYDIVKRLTFVALEALILTAPYWYSAFSAIGGSKDAAERTGMFFTHEPVLNKLLLVATVICAALYCLARWRKALLEDKVPLYFSFALLAAGWIAFNEQVITGRDIWHHHFVQYAIPMATIATLTMLFFTLKQYRMWKWGMIAAIIVSLMFGLYSTRNIVPRLEGFIHQQSYGSLTSWLNAHTEKDCSVLVYEEEENAARFIPAYSHCNIYLTSYTFSGVPMERIKHNFFLRMRLFGVTPKDAQEYLRSHESAVRGTFFKDWNQALMNSDPEWFEALVPELAKEYGTFVKGNVEGQVRIYRVDFLASESPLPSALTRQLPHLKERAVIENWHMYGFE